MTERDGDRRARHEGGGGANKARQEQLKQDRLKLALRENLKRRKTQARGRGDTAAVPTGGAAASLDETGGDKPGE